MILRIRCWSLLFWTVFLVPIWLGNRLLAPFLVLLLVWVSFDWPSLVCNGALRPILSFILMAFSYSPVVSVRSWCLLSYFFRDTLFALYRLFWVLSVVWRLFSVSLLMTTEISRSLPRYLLLYTRFRLSCAWPLLVLNLSIILAFQILLPIIRILIFVCLGLLQSPGPCDILF